MVLKSIPKSTLEPFFRKRIYFNDEHEIRVIYQEMDNQDTGSTIDIISSGTYILVDMDKLIENIYISPKAEKWFHDLVQSVMDKYGLMRKVIESSLGDHLRYSEKWETSGNNVFIVPYGKMSDSSGNINFAVAENKILITNRKME